MASGTYISMSAMAARLRQLDDIADNLANSQTVGFKAKKTAFEAFMVGGRDESGDDRGGALGGRPVFRVPARDE